MPIEEDLHRVRYWHEPVNENQSFLVVQDSSTFIAAVKQRGDDPN
jgi:hypothetical protein